MTTFRYGSLYVVEGDRDRSWITRALRQIDERLFLERQLTFDGQAVWCVVCALDSGEPPMTLLEWRDERGQPIPEPTEQLVQRVAAMERDGHRLHQRVLAKNRALQEERRRKLEDEVREATRYVLPTMSETRSALLPRGQHLRISRDKQRALGRNI